MPQALPSDAQSYYSDSDITSSDLNSFFQAARALWDAQRSMSNEVSLFRVDIPSLGVHGGCCEVLDEVESPGLVLCSSTRAYRGLVSVVGGCAIAPQPGDSALYLTFEQASTLSRALRDEAHACGWKMPEGRQVYPQLRCVAFDKTLPTSRAHVLTATALARAVSSIATSQPYVFDTSDQPPTEITHRDDVGLESRVTIPHPEHKRLAFRVVMAASTLYEENPYDLPLSAVDLTRLKQTLGAPLIHRLVGTMCAALSVPQAVSPEQYFEQLVQEVRFSDNAKRLGALAAVKTCHQDFQERLQQFEFDLMVPCSFDPSACAEWARGYTNILLDALDIDDVADSELDAVISIQALAGFAPAVQALAQQHGADSQSYAISECRDFLGSSMERLFEAWEEARKTGARNAS